MITSPMLVCNLLLWMCGSVAFPGFPWSVIRVDGRSPCLAALEHASVDLDIRPFARFAGDRVLRSMEPAG